MRPPFRSTALTFALVLLTSGVLAGCAAQLAYREGQALAAQENIEASLEKFQLAMQADSSNAQYRQAWLQTRERAVYRWLAEADKRAAAGEYEEAEELYQRVLGIDPSNERARRARQAQLTTQRHAKLIREARAALEKRDLATARARLATVMTENPQDAGALALQSDLARRFPAEPAENALGAAFRKPVTIEFRDTALRQVFDIIARSAGLNFIFDKDVKLDQRSSIFLRNSTVEAALHYTLLTNQLEMQVLDGNSVLVFPNTAAKQNEYQELVVRSFFLANADAKTVANTIKTILKTRDLVVDEKLNMLIMRDNAAAIRLAEKLVSLHDVPEPEVMLEVEILEVKRTRLQELGIQWPNNVALSPLPSANGKSLTLADLRGGVLNSTTIGAALGATTVRARKEDGDANLLANPRIRARNHEKAKILIGERVPNITTTSTASGFVAESVSYLDVGLKLDVEPTVYLDDDVAIRISMEVSSVTNQIKTQTGSVAYQIGTRTASTVLRLKDGENQVLAGLINDEDRRSANKVPLIGELPLLGRLFGSQSDDKQKTEIVLSITPRLVRNIQRPQADAAQFSSGTGSSLRGRPETVSAPAGGAAGLAPGVPGARNSTAALQAMQQPHERSTGINAPAASPGSAAAGAFASDAGMVAGAGAAAANAVQWLWQGPRQVRVGDTFTLQLYMQSAQPVSSLPLTLRFDNAVFDVVNVSGGAFLKQGGVQDTFTQQATAGSISTTDSRPAGNGNINGASGSDTVLALTLRALAPADASLLQLASAAPAGVNGQPLPRVLPAPLAIQVAP